MKRPVPMTAEEAVLKHIRGRKYSWKTRRFAKLIESIYSLGGCDGVLMWATSRVDQGIGSPAEIHQLRALLKATQYAEERGHKALMKQWERELFVRQYEQLWLRLLQERDLEERAKSWRADPREAIRQRLVATGVV